MYLTSSYEHVFSIKSKLMRNACSLVISVHVILSYSNVQSLKLTLLRSYGHNVTIYCQILCHPIKLNKYKQL